MSRAGRRAAPDPTLRRRAEARLERLAEGDVDALSAEQARELLQELQVHQIELEMQNDELRQAQQELEASRSALAASEARYRDLYEFAPVGYLTLEADGSIAQANLGAAQTLGVARSELVGRSLSDFVAPADQDRWFKGRRAAAADDPVPPLELALDRAEGGHLHAELALSAEDGEGGRPARIRVALLDVSERRRTEIALRTATAREILAEQRERRDLARVLHEDIAQDLAALGMQVASLERDAPQERREEILAKLKKLSQRVAAFGTQLFPTVLFDLGIVAATEWLAEDVERRHGLKVRVPEIEEIADLDETARISLFRVLRELLRNAAQHAGVQEVRVRIGQDGPWVHVEVEDSGVGFEDGLEATGLGLLHARERLAQLGGSLEVWSRRGQGTRVRASLPARIDAARVGNAPA